VVGVERWKSLAQDPGEQRFDVVDDADHDAPRPELAEDLRQDPVDVDQMVDDVNQGDEVEVLGRIWDGLVELRGDDAARHRAGLLGGDRIRLDPMELAKAVLPGDVQEDADVAADVQDAITARDVGPGEVVIAGERPPTLSSSPPGTLVCDASS
jgi:hypothetical protein